MENLLDFFVVFPRTSMAQSVGAAVYTDSISAEG